MKLDLKAKTGEMTLNSGHSLFIGNLPEALGVDMFSDVITKIEHKEGSLDLGLFEASTPNYTTYYPDVTPEDLIPRDDEFIYPVFRALSATVVWKGYKPIDFGKAGVLKAAMKMLVGQTINADHETALGNAMGSVKPVAWQESYTADGVLVPAGINAEFKIDGKSNPRIARAIQMDPPAIHSNSVSVRFAWEPSHKLKSDEDFYSKLGTKDEKGNLYRLVVTEILQFSETSLVAHGADAYAQIIRDGKINNPKYAAGVYQFSFTSKDDKDKAVEIPHSFDYKLDLKADTIPLELNNNDKDNENMELIKLIEGLTGAEAGSLTEDTAIDAIKLFVTKSTDNLTEELATAKDDLTKVQGEKETLETSVQTLTQEKTDLEAKALLGTKYEEVLSAKRENAKKLYNLSMGDKKDEAILTMLDTCDEAVLTGLANQYEADVKAKFPDTCKKCGSHEFNKSSAFTEEEDDLNPKTSSRSLQRTELKGLARERKINNHRQPKGDK